MDQPPSFDDGRPPFDHDIAAGLIGKYVIVGITRLDPEGNVLTKEQFHGTVVVADARQGICVKCLGRRGGEFEWLPPDTRAFAKARPGDYRLRSTGEVIIDPDFTTTWTYRADKKALN